MQRNVYALIVGIDKFKYRGIDLGGCVNDAKYMLQYIEGLCGRKNYGLHKVELYDDQATRNNILIQFQSHFLQATANDIIFFFFASHGSTEAAHPYFEENNNELNTFVCHDSRTPDPKDSSKIVKDILDKELRFLIRKVWEKTNAEIIIIQDSCHSGGATRFMHKTIKPRKVRKTAFQMRKTPVRLTRNFVIGSAATALGTAQQARCHKAQNKIKRDVQDFLVNDPDAPQAVREIAQSVQSDLSRYLFGDGATMTGTATRSGNMGSSQKKLPFSEAFPEGNHIHLAACTKEQYAYEGMQETKDANGKAMRGGNFTHTLVHILQQTEGDINYEDLQKFVVSGVQAKNKQQSPMFTFVYPKAGVNKLKQRFFEVEEDKNLAPTYTKLIPITHKEFKDTNGATILGGWFMLMGGADALKIVRLGLDTPLPVMVVEPKQTPNGVEKKSYPAKIVAVIADKAKIVFDEEQPSLSNYSRCRAVIDETHLNLKPLRILMEDSAANWAYPLEAELRAEMAKSRYMANQTLRNYEIAIVSDAAQADVSISLDTKTANLIFKHIQYPDLPAPLGGIRATMAVKLLDELATAKAKSVIHIHVVSPYQNPQQLLEQPANARYRHFFNFVDAAGKPNYYLRLVDKNWEVYYKMPDLAVKETLHDVVVIRLSIFTPPLLEPNTEGGQDARPVLFQYLERIANWETVRLMANPYMSNELKFVKKADDTFDQTQLAVQLQMQRLIANPNAQAAAEETDDTGLGIETQEPATMLSPFVDVPIREGALLQYAPSLMTPSDLRMVENIKFKVINRSPYPLYIAALWLDELYGVDIAAGGAQATAKEQGGEILLYPGKKTDLLRKNCFKNVPYVVCFVKLIFGASEFFNTNGLLQQPLPEPDEQDAAGKKATRALSDTFGFGYGDWGALSYRIIIKNS